MLFFGRRNPLPIELVFLKTVMFALGLHQISPFLVKINMDLVARTALFGS